MDDEDGLSVVMDSGSTTIKAGIAGEEAPKLIFPSMVGYPQELAHLELKTGETWKGQYHVGAEAQQKRESLLLKCPFEKGIVTDWDVIEKLWTHAFTQLLMSPAEEYGGVLLADAPNNPKDGRERMTHMMFERFQLPNFYIASQPLLAMYAAGRTTGVVVDCGHHLTHVVPLVEGYPLPYATQQFNVAGRDLTSWLAKTLTSDTKKVDIDCATTIKEELCYVSLNYQDEMRSFQGNEKQFPLPDGQALTVGDEQIRASETLFTPSLMGSTSPGLPQIVYKTVMDCEYESRKDLMANIVVAGGTSLLKNFPDRLQRELTLLAPSTQKPAVYAMPERLHCVWFGGSILSSLNTFHQMWITKEEYDESGPAIVHRKCI